MGSKGGGGTSTTNTIAEPWSGAQPVLRELLEGTTGAYRTGMLDVPSWPGMRVAPQSTMTQTAQQGFYDTATGGNPYMQPTQDAFSRMVSGDVSADLSGVKENVLADVIPAVSSRFANAGMLDSSMAADTIGRAASSAVAPIEYGAWENAQNRALQTMGEAPRLSAMRYLDPQMLAASGAQQDQYQQRLLDAAQQQWYEEANRPFDQLQRASSLALGFGGMGEQRTSEQEQPGGSAIGGIMQAAAFPLMLALSDRRLKTGVRHIGEAGEGYPKYEFRYLWDAPGTVHIGVMSDEVPEEITLTDPLGFKWVNYAGVTL